VFKDYGSLVQLMDDFPDEESCVKHLESIRWQCGIVCPHCGEVGNSYRLKRGHKYRCNACRKDFSVRKGTIFEESRLPLRKWFAAIWLFTSHRKGLPSTQLSREIGVTQKTAWHMLGRLRLVAEQIEGYKGPPDGPAEIDETCIGGKRKNMSNAKRKALKGTGRGSVGKKPVVGTRSRSGKVKVQALDRCTAERLQAFVTENIKLGSHICTDSATAYKGIPGCEHESVHHSISECVRGQAHTNGIESFRALLKRGCIGTFHHFTWKHLHRYLSEFQARFNMKEISGYDRLALMPGNASGLRLPYQHMIAQWAASRNC